MPPLGVFPPDHTDRSCTGPENAARIHRGAGQDSESVTRGHRLIGPSDPRRHGFVGKRRSPLFVLFDERHIDESVIPLPGIHGLALCIDRPGHDHLYSLRVVGDGLRGESANPGK